MRYLAGQVTDWAGTLAVGVGTTLPTENDTRLTYEIDRATVTIKSIDLINNKLIVKTTLNQETIGKLYEISIYSNSLTNDLSRSLVVFEQDKETWSLGNWSSTNSRIGEESLRLNLPAGGNVTTTYQDAFIDLSENEPTDILSFAYFSANNVTNTRIRLLNDTNNYLEYSFSPLVNYNVVSFKLSDMTKIGSSFDFSSINSLSFVSTARAGTAAIIDLDGLRIDQLDEENVLVARELLQEPKVKTGLSPMDAEYYLGFSLA